MLRDEECMVMVSFYINVNKAVALSATEGQSSRVILNTIRNEPLLLLAQPHLEGPRGEHSMDFSCNSIFSESTEPNLDGQKQALNRSNFVAILRPLES